MSASYLKAIGAPLAVAELELYFAPPGLDLLGGCVRRVDSGVAMARRLRVSPPMVRAALFERFMETVIDEGWSTALAIAQAGGLPDRVPSP